MKGIAPILPEEFNNKLQTQNNQNTVDYAVYFKPAVEQIINFAIAPFCWFIPDNRQMKIVAASENIGQLTPFSKDEWVGQGASFFASNAHPDDAHFLLAATAKGAEMDENQQIKNSTDIRVNIYCRMLDRNRNSRWTLIQYPAHYYNVEGRIESTLCVMTDLSSFNMVNKPMLTFIDNSNKEHQYFKVVMGEKDLIPIGLPHITKREQEILQLMVKGINTPQIAKQLNISYHTVENHKKNLREKTKVKTSAELVYYVMANNLL